MINWRETPEPNDIAKLVQCYWFIEKESGDITEQFPRLNPDPAGTLILAPKNQAYSYQNDNELFEGTGDHWIYPNSQVFQLDHTDPFQIIGIKFHVGALYSLHTDPSPPIIDEVKKAALERITGLNLLEKSSLFELARNASTDCASALNELLMPWLSQIPLKKSSELCQKVVPRLAHTPVSKLGALFHASQRTIERQFLSATGLTLKQCQSMNRFESMLERLYLLEPDKVSWLDLVEEFGFSDQPHLIRYLKSMIGVTPNQYLKDRNLTIDTYGDFE